MKKTLFGFIFFVCLLISSPMHAAEDLINAEILKNHFTDMAYFTKWYQSLNQTDKNQVLGGTVALCEPDLTEIALQNGGDVNTPVYVLHQFLHHLGNNFYDTLIYTYNTKEAMLADAETRLAGEKTNEKMNSKKHQTVWTPNFAEFEESSLLKQTLKNSNAQCSCAKKIRLVRILSEHGTPTDIQDIFTQLLYTLEDDEYTENHNSEQTTDNSCMDLLHFVLKTLPKELIDENTMTSALIQAYFNNSPEVVDVLKNAGFKIYPQTQAAYDGFLTAAAQDDLPLLQQLLDAGVNIDYQNENGDTALALSVRHNNAHIAAFLLENGADPLLKNHKNQSPFYECGYDICRLHQEGLKEFQATGVNAAWSLKDAVEKNNCEVINAYLEKNYNPYTDVFGTPLLFLTLQNPEKSLCLPNILKGGLPLDIVKKDGLVPLLYAAQKHNFEAVRQLIEHGAQIDAQDQNDNTALTYAVIDGDIATIRFLLENKAKTNIRNKKGVTALLYAAKHNNLAAVKLLVEHGTNINEHDKNGNTPLHYSIPNNNAEMAEFLLAHEAKTDIKNVDGLSVLNICAQKTYKKTKSCKVIRQTLEDKNTQQTEPQTAPDSVKPNSTDKKE
ncbi:MAG: ankyrin repeat domain-containing protein [Alphaproteobacteria bacterium]|nr:ankyrin repeat domain-containing protein [Alphaproteobacteria bacterium]